MRMKLSTNLTENLTRLQEALGHSPDLIIRTVESRNGLLAGRVAVAYVAGLVDERMIQEAIVAPLQVRSSQPDAQVSDLASQVMQTPGYSYASKWDDVIDNLLRGATAVFLDGHAEAMLAATQGGQQRSPDEPPSEPAVRGPRVGFVEALTVNRALIRRRLVDSALRFEPATIGQSSSTRVDIVYLEGKAPAELVAEVRKRVKAIRTNGILDTGTIAEFIEDQPWSPFPQIHHTERPDRVVADLLSGKVVVLSDGSPTALLAPAVFWDFLEVPEDYYERWWAATLVRLFRALSVFTSFTLPALWVSLTAFHQELLPTPLALSVAGGRERIPLPAVLEALVLEVAFEILREAGARLPRSWGQATSIVGGLVIGQAAVQAGLVSPSMVIIVATTGLASFATPGFSAAYAFRILRFGTLLLSGSFGVLGFGFGLVLVIMHLLHLKSFGVEYLSPILPYMPKGADDVLVRVPWPVMKSTGTRWWKR